MKDLDPEWAKRGSYTLELARMKVIPLAEARIGDDAIGWEQGYVKNQIGEITDPVGGRIKVDVGGEEYRFYHHSGVMILRYSEA